MKQEDKPLSKQLEEGVLNALGLESNSTTATKIPVAKTATTAAPKVSAATINAQKEIARRKAEQKRQAYLTQKVMRNSTDIRKLRKDLDAEKKLVQQLMAKWEKQNATVLSKLSALQAQKMRKKYHQGAKFIAKKKLRKRRVTAAPIKSNIIRKSNVNRNTARPAVRPRIVRSTTPKTSIKRPIARKRSVSPIARPRMIRKPIPRVSIRPKTRFTKKPVAVAKHRNLRNIISSFGKRSSIILKKRFAKRRFQTKKPMATPTRKGSFLKKIISQKRKVVAPQRRPTIQRKVTVKRRISTPLRRPTLVSRFGKRRRRR